MTQRCIESITIYNIETLKTKNPNPYMFNSKKNQRCPPIDMETNHMDESSKFKNKISLIYMILELIIKQNDNEFS